MDRDNDIGGSVIVVPTEDVISRLDDSHTPPARWEIRGAMNTLERQGMIEPLDEPLDRFHLTFLYAAVELGWETVIITQRREDSNG